MAETKKIFTMRFSDDSRKQLSAIADQREVPLAQVVRDAIREYLKANHAA
ncbi:hypothetical protein GNF10_12205 [Nostoc sp. UCD121]|nr:MULTISPECIES: hypothetical protein [unclassified Nostoc]MBC1224152.1 hypothetical protein [Nostoc sp. UCD120]MBC1276726.1 hypothetical protein [Nostoc sp. UCD121]MBC1296574.1 hypothetical protein [Nostoc sp. UCD122]